jgi:circadian clock protein KaiC
MGHMAELSPVAAQLTRLPTGVAGFDRILQGGFFRGGLYIIAGPPGGGKTILGNQLCFEHVASGGRAIFMTLLTESHSRMLAHLSTLTFYDPTPIGHTLLYLSGYSVLLAEGLAGLLKLLRQVIRDHVATMLVLDGLTNAEAVADVPLELKQLLHDLHAFTEVSGCTIFLLAHQDGDLLVLPEHTMVDGVVALSSHRVSVRSIREIEIWKLRGSAFVEGRHFCTITDAGITVYPRTEVVLDGATFDVSSERGRRSFGIAQLDAMLQGGLLTGTATLVVGPAGSGKTLLGLHFLTAGAQAGEPGLYFGLYEPPPDLIAKADKVGLDLSRWVASGQIAMLWQPVLENSLDVLAAQLMQVIATHGIQRVFIDGLQGMQTLTAYPERLNRFLTALSNELRIRQITTLFTIEISDLLSPTVVIPIEGLSALADNLILLRQVELRSQLYRLLSILKVRASDYDTAIREFQITNQGIEVAATFESADAILTGVARTTGAKAVRTRRKP